MNNQPSSKDHIFSIIEAASVILEQQKEIIRGQHPSQEYEASKDKLLENASALKTILDMYDDKEDQHKKNKRAIDDAIADIKIAKRPIKALHDDLKEWGRRATNEFWSAKKQGQ